MSEKPEALRLAENLENPWWGMTASPSGLPVVSPIAVGALRVDAARMIRDQRDEIERLKAENERLREKNERLREALKLALNSHGRMLMSDPPQDPWKVNRVDEVIRELLQEPPR